MHASNQLKTCSGSPYTHASCRCLEHFSASAPKHCIIYRFCKQAYRSYIIDKVCIWAHRHHNKMNSVTNLQVLEWRSWFNSIYWNEWCLVQKWSESNASTNGGLVWTYTDLAEMVSYLSDGHWVPLCQEHISALRLYIGTCTCWLPYYKISCSGRWFLPYTPVLWCHASIGLSCVNQIGQVFLPHCFLGITLFKC